MGLPWGQISAHKVATIIDVAWWEGMHQSELEICTGRAGVGMGMPVGKA